MEIIYADVERIVGTAVEVSGKLIQGQLGLCTDTESLMFRDYSDVYHVFTKTGTGSTGGGAGISGLTPQYIPYAATSSGLADSYIYQHANTSVNIGGTSLSGAALAVQGPGGYYHMLVGSNIGDRDLTNNANKGSRIGAPHYTNTNPAITLLDMSSTSTSNKLNIGGGIVGGGAATEIALYTTPTPTGVTGATRMTIDASGYTGINTSTPNRRLAVRELTGDPQLRLEYSNTIYSDIQTTNLGDLSLLPLGSGVAINTTIANYALDVNAGVDNIVARFKSADDTGSIRVEDDDTIVYLTAKDGYCSVGPNVGVGGANMIIGASNVGFGTGTTPSGVFHVKAGASNVAAASAANTMVLEHSTSHGMTILTGDAGTARYYMGSTSDNDGAQIEWKYGTSGADQKLAISTNSPSGYIAFNTGSKSEKMRLNASGNLTIGTATQLNEPKLHIQNGSALATNSNVPAGTSLLIESNHESGCWLSMEGNPSYKTGLVLGVYSNMNNKIYFEQASGIVIDATNIVLDSNVKVTSLGEGVVKSDSNGTLTISSGVYAGYWDNSTIDYTLAGTPLKLDLSIAYPSAGGLEIIPASDGIKIHRSGNYEIAGSASVTWKGASAGNVWLDVYNNSGILDLGSYAGATATASGVMVQLTTMTYATLASGNLLDLRIDGFSGNTVSVLNPKLFIRRLDS